MKKLFFILALTMCFFVTSFAQDSLNFTDENLSYITKSGGEILVCKSAVKTGSGTSKKIEYETVESVKGVIKYSKYENFVEKPKYEISTDKDEFTESVTKSTKINSIGQTYGDIFYMSFNVTISKVERKDSTHSYYIFCWYSTEFMLQNIGCGGAVGNSLTLKLSNGEFITLGKDLAKISCSREMSNTSVFCISDEDKSTLMENQVTEIRLKQTDGYLDFKVFYRNFFRNAFLKLDE